MNHEEIPALECEDAPGWLSLVQSRDDEVATKFGATSVDAHCRVDSNAGA